jgi:small subunit ribosomal protein S6
MKTRDYEAMFLLDNTAATADFDGTAAIVDRLVEKNGGKIVRKEKWDERKLSYEIKGHRRATYYLVYFNAPTSILADLRRDVHLAPIVLRHLVIGLVEPIDQHVSQRAEEREKMAEDSRKNSITSGWGEPRRGEGGRSRGEPVMAGGGPEGVPEVEDVPDEEMET